MANEWQKANGTGQIAGDENPLPFASHLSLKNIKKMESNKVNSFEDLLVWKEAMQLVLMGYKEMKDCKDYGFKDQIQRAAVSVPSNIAEGFERNTDKEFVQFLYISRGSCAEVRTQTYLAISLNYSSKEKGTELLNKAIKVSSMIYKLIEYRKKSIKNNII
jgi:four helix bundle protein